MTQGMSLSWIINIALILLCVGVLIQTARLMIHFRRFKQTGLAETVATLEQATHSAQMVLDNLRTVLAVEMRAQTAVIASAGEMRDRLDALRDELSVMVELGNSVAERIEGAAEAVRITAMPTEETAEETAETPAKIKIKPRRRADRPAAIRKPSGPAVAVALEAGA